MQLKTDDMLKELGLLHMEVVALQSECEENLQALSSAQTELAKAKQDAKRLSRQASGAGTAQKRAEELEQLVAEQEANLIALNEKLMGRAKPGEAMQ